MLVLDGVTRRFGSLAAVSGASFEVPRGGFVGVIGRSGAGKSTLLRMINRLVDPSEGRILFEGRDVAALRGRDLRLWRARAAMIFQQFNLVGRLDVLTNVLTGRLAEVSTWRAVTRSWSEDDKAIAFSALEQFEIGALAAQRAEQLSGGQQQRVAIARALVFEPDLLLLDEPLAALDRKLREEMQLEFRRIQRELGVTTINVTHDQREALVVSDEVIVMDKGVIQQKAPPSETYRTPSNAFVAGFIGVTNFISGKVTATSGDTVTFAVGGGEVTGTWAARSTGPSVGASVTGALRAEQVRLAASEAELAGCQTVRSGVVRDAIFEGERLVYEIDLTPGTLLRVFDHDPTAHKQFAIGDNVVMGWNARDVLTFPN